MKETKRMKMKNKAKGYGRTKDYNFSIKSNGLVQIKIPRFLSKDKGIWHKWSEDKIQNLVWAIIEEFEGLLESKRMKIPSKDREVINPKTIREDTEACIYGTEYYNLEERITSIIRKALKEKK